MISLIFVTLTSINLIASPANAVEISSVKTFHPDEVFYSANEKYQAGDYDAAVKEYLSLRGKGFASGNLFYNLGNAYLKADNVPRAILNYERAKRYIPGDSDLSLNLRHAKSLMKRPDPASNAFIAIQWLDLAFDRMTLPQSVALATLVYWLIIAYFIIAKVLKKYNKYSSLVLFFMVLLLVVIIIPVKYKIYDLEKGGIVVEKIIDARLEPRTDAKVNYPLYGGMKVFVLRKRGGWLRVKATDGRIGWIPESSAEIIGM